MSDTTKPDLCADLCPDLCIDITAELCPMTSVRTRLALDRLQPGQLLSIRLHGEEPERSIPALAARQGHTILSQTIDAAGITHLLLRKKVPPAPAP